MTSPPPVIVTPAPSNQGAPYWGGFARRAPKFGRLKSVFEQAVATVPTVGDTLKTLDYHHAPREGPYQHWTGVPSPALITPSEHKIRHATQNRRHSPSGQGLDSPRHDRPTPLIVHGPHDIKGATGTNRPDPHQLKRLPQALPCNKPPRTSTSNITVCLLPFTSVRDQITYESQEG